LKIHEITTVAEYQPQRKHKRKKRKKYFHFLIYIDKWDFCGYFSMRWFVSIISVNRIEVYGNKHYNSNEVIEASGLVIGNNWFKSNSVNLKGILTFRSIDAENLLLNRCPYLKVR